MASVTRVLGHIWIPLASGRAEHRGAIKASFHGTGLSTGPPPLSAREVGRGGGGGGGRAQRDMRSGRGRMRRGRVENSYEGRGRRQRRVAEGRKVRKDRGEVHEAEEEEEDEEKTVKRQKVAEQIRVKFLLHLWEFMQKVKVMQKCIEMTGCFPSSTLCSCLEDKTNFVQYKCSCSWLVLITGEDGKLVTMRFLTTMQIFPKLSNYSFNEWVINEFVCSSCTSQCFNQAVSCQRRR